MFGGAGWTIGGSTKFGGSGWTIGWLRLGSLRISRASVDSFLGTLDAGSEEIRGLNVVATWMGNAPIAATWVVIASAISWRTACKSGSVRSMSRYIGLVWKNVVKSKVWMRSIRSLIATTIWPAYKSCFLPPTVISMGPRRLFVNAPMIVVLLSSM